MTTTLHNIHEPRGRLGLEDIQQFFDFVGQMIPINEDDHEPEDADDEIGVTLAFEDDVESHGKERHATPTFLNPVWCGYYPPGLRPLEPGAVDRRLHHSVERCHTCVLRMVSVVRQLAAFLTAAGCAGTLTHAGRAVAGCLWHGGPK